MISRRPRPFATVVASILMLTGAALWALDAFPTLQASSRLTALVSSFTPYGIVAWALAAVILLISARGTGRLVSLLAFAGMFVHAGILLPYFQTSYLAPPGTQPTVKMIMLNMHYGHADLDQLWSRVEAEKPDVVVLTEFTEQSAEILADPRWQAMLPYHLGTTGRSSDRDQFGDASGTQVLSRTPLTQLGQASGTQNANLAVQVTTGQRSLVLIAAHPVNPVRGNLDGWLTEGAILSDFVAGYTPGPVVVAGDLNSVPEHLTIHNLVARTGLHQTTQGWQPSYPADRMVPLITIDQVLASDQFTTVRVARFRVANTDHLGSVVELAQS
ncbi:MAG: endonuclease/exonuclease/phosphatase family protein [Propionibacteriales bacterium]|nr:endonuclease/exonuclease/phosphatase family protein [Propionibacteriales bacterium]